MCIKIILRFVKIVGFFIGSVAQLDRAMVS